MRKFDKAAEAVKRGARNVRAKAAAAGTGLMVAAGSAMATGTPTPFDSSTIVAKIEENTGVAVVIIGALILGVWTLRSMGLLKGRG